MKNLNGFALALSASLVLSFGSVPAQAGILGQIVQDSQSASLEGQATLVTSSREMNSAEEVKVIAPTSDADAVLKIALLDNKADVAKDKSAAAYDKAAEYLTLAQDATDNTVKAKFVAAADTYEKTAYFYSVTSDLYLTAEQKTEVLAAKLPDSKTSAETATDLKVISLKDATLALTEAKAEVEVQKNAAQLVADASDSVLTVGTTNGLDQANETLEGLVTAVTEKKAAISELVTDYQGKAAASTGAIKQTYTAVVNQYKAAAAIATTSVSDGATASSRFINAVPENPTNPGENLKWHIFQSDPNTALAVMKYNYAQFAFSAIHWQGMAQSIAQNPDEYLNPANHQETITEYINGFRSSALQVSSEANDLRTLISKYNDQVAGASDADALTWSQVSSYLTDIVSIYDEISQSQYEIYTTLSAQKSIAVTKAYLVTETPEVKTVLKTGEKVVPLAGEVQAGGSTGETTMNVYTTAPGAKVSFVLSKPGTKSVTVNSVADSSGYAATTLAKDYTGYTVAVSVSGKLLDKEKVESGLKTQ